MSRPKTGSETDAVELKGTWLRQSRTVSQRPDTDAASASETRTATAAASQTAIGVRSGISISTADPRPGQSGRRYWPGPELPNGPPPNGPPRPSPRPSSVPDCISCSSQPRTRLRRFGSGGGTSRPAIQRLPSRNSSARASTSRNSPTCALRRAQNTSPKPTLRYHMLSVMRSISEPERASRIRRRR